MVRKENILKAPIFIRYSGVFDLTGLYRMVRDWATKQKYDIKEPIYKDKPYSSVGNEIEIEMLFEAKLDAYIQNVISLKYHTFEGIWVDVMDNGQKKKMYKGRLEIIINATTFVDYNNKFEESGFKKSLGKLLFGTIMKNDINFKILDPFMNDVYELDSKIKKFLNFEAE